MKYVFPTLAAALAIAFGFAFVAASPAAADDHGWYRKNHKDRPQFCPQVYDPVCGVNGQTYSNSCFARINGVAIAHQGECREKHFDHHKGHPYGDDTIESYDFGLFSGVFPRYRLNLHEQWRNTGWNYPWRW